MRTTSLRPHLAVSLIAALTLAACGSDPAPDAADAGGPGANTLDVCALVPKATADLILGDARNPDNTSGRADSGNCAWHGAVAGQIAVISVSGSGINADVFAQVCTGDSPPLPMLRDLGVGVAACGRFDPAGGGNLWIQLDATTTMIGISTSMGTQDQAIAVLRDLAARLAR